jgi:hypothetical protein
MHRRFSEAYLFFYCSYSKVYILREDRVIVVGSVCRQGVIGQFSIGLSLRTFNRYCRAGEASAQKFTYSMQISLDLLKVNRGSRNLRPCWSRLDPRRTPSSFPFYQRDALVGDCVSAMFLDRSRARGCRASRLLRNSSVRLGGMSVI